MSPLKVGFKVVAFGPFVPRIDKHNGFGQAVEGEAISEHGAEPVAVCLGSGAMQDGGAAVAAAGGVIPGGQHAGDAQVADW